MPLQIRQARANDLSEAELASIVALRNAIDPDIRPGDPAYPPALVLAEIDTPSDYRAETTWVGWLDGHAVAGGACETDSAPENADRCEIIFGVHPDHRRRGFGRQMFEHLLAVAHDAQRTIVQPWLELSDETEGFFEHLGWSLAMNSRISRVDLAATDEALMQEWVDRAAERAGDYHLEQWVGPCPDHLIDALVQAAHGMNEAPVDDLMINHMSFSVDRIRDRERRDEARRQEVRNVLAIETATGAGVGYTNVHILNDRPSHSWQGDTTTLIPHRHRGLGRWMKAAMWQWLRADRPDVRYLDTGNAESNDAMLAINVAMGFEPSFRYGAWQHPDAAPND